MYQCSHQHMHAPDEIYSTTLACAHACFLSPMMWPPKKGAISTMGWLYSTGCPSSTAKLTISPACGACAEIKPLSSACPDFATRSRMGWFVFHQLALLHSDLSSLRRLHLHKESQPSGFESCSHLHRLLWPTSLPANPPNERGDSHQADMRQLHCGIRAEHTLPG